jgi:hypothetical protein
VIAVTSLLRRLLPFLAAGLLAAVLYDAWIFYSRWSDARRSDQQTREKESSDARKTIEMLGGGELKILDFYASPSVVKRGAHANLCFGIAGAKSVRIEPFVEDLHPALSHCMQISPAADTNYKLTAEDAAGHQAVQSVLVKVVP